MESPNTLWYAKSLEYVVEDLDTVLQKVEHHGVFPEYAWYFGNEGYHYCLFTLCIKSFEL